MSQKRNRKDGFTEDLDYIPAAPDEELPVKGSKKFEKLPWPEDVPILIEDDIELKNDRRNSWKDKTKRRTLQQWIIDVFPPGLCFKIVRRELDRKILERFPKLPWYQSCYESKKNLPVLVQIWSEIVCWLGYEVSSSTKKKKSVMELSDEFEI